MTHYITTTYEQFWNDVPTNYVPAMITYGRDAGRDTIYLHYRELSREQLETYWQQDNLFDVAIQCFYGRSDDFEEMIHQVWPSVTMLYFGCSCCIDDLYEFASCFCGASVGRHIVGCVDSFHRDSLERIQAKADMDAGNLAGYYGRRCPPGKSVAWKQGYHLGRTDWWKRRFDNGGRRKM